MKASEIIRREQQHIRLLIPCLEVLNIIISKLYASKIKTFRNTELLMEILKVKSAITALPAYRGTCPPFFSSGHCLLLHRVNALISSVFSNWKWNTMLTKVMDLLLTGPKHYMAAMELLLTLLPPPLPLPRNLGFFLPSSYDRD